MKAIVEGKSPTIFGDGEQTRDFTYVQNAVDANILALFGDAPRAYGKNFNVACGKTHSINSVFETINKSIHHSLGSKRIIKPIFGEPRSGDIKDSLADLSLIRDTLGYEPKISFVDGINETVSWFLSEN